jgi:hypothetical protein
MVEFLADVNGAIDVFARPMQVADGPLLMTDQTIILRQCEPVVPVSGAGVDLFPDFQRSLIAGQRSLRVA